MSDNRPVFYNLFLIRFPVAAIMSIIHRISGVVMVLAIPALTYMLDLSLKSEQGFQQARDLLGHWFITLVLILLGWGLMHHLLAGIRYLGLDFDVAIEKQQARVTAWLVLILAAAIAAGFGVWVLL
jgi:succinate dehydrogenase / fumarate reductase cytochrome b subunit